jgi:hypothetical protein
LWMRSVRAVRACLASLRRRRHCLSHASPARPSSCALPGGIGTSPHHMCLRCACCCCCVAAARVATVRCVRSRPPTAAVSLRCMPRAHAATRDGVALPPTFSSDLAAKCCVCIALLDRPSFLAMSRSLTGC